MKTDSGISISPWMADFSMPVFPKLNHDCAADVCVIGAGITGVTTAYLLAKEGKSIVLIEDGNIGGGETGRTTAHLVNALDDRFYELEKLHGEKGARLAAESHSASIDRIEQIVLAENIQCDFLRVDGFLFEPPDGDPRNLEKELQASHKAGLTGVELIPQAPLPFDTGPALRFPRQAQFHPLKYLRRLVEIIQQRGGQIYNATHASKFVGGESPEVITRDGFQIRAGSIVVATNVPVNDRVLIHTKQAAYRTYVIGIKIPKNSIPLGLYWDNADPYHYIRLQKTAESESSSFDLLIVGGEDHKTGQQEDLEAPFHNLEAWTRQHFPMATEVEFKWSGQIIEPVDSLGFIGHNPVGGKNVYVATGDSGNGMTNGTVAGILITDLIMGRENAWSDLFDPRRKTLRAVPDFARENLNVAAQYGDWMTPAEVDSVDQIRAGTGAILRCGTTKRAVFRDDSGQVHAFSAVCPHLGCMVSWNDSEKTWDCPCHGSRFDCRGNVVNGPAREGLKKVDIAEQEQQQTAGRTH